MRKLMLTIALKIPVVREFYRLEALAKESEQKVVQSHDALIDSIYKLQESKTELLYRAMHPDERRPG